jgi:hypothetical protein
MTREAITAFAAGYMMGSENPIADPEILNVFAGFYDFTCDFVT